MTGPRLVKAGRGLIASLLALGAAPAAAQTGEPQLQSLIATLNAGDDAEYATQIRSTFDPAALAESPPEERADRLARIYASTRGFDRLQTMRREPGLVSAAAVSRMTGLRYCVTLRRTQDSGRPTAFAAVEWPQTEPRAGPATPREAARELEAFVDRMARADAFSGVILLAKDGRPILRKAYGWAGAGQGAGMRLDTRLNVASVGKSFTAVAIAQLAEQGRLSLDDNVGRHLPDFPNASVRERVTIRQLLTHTSGIPELPYDSQDYALRRYRLRTVADYVPLLSWGPLEFEPGARYAYSSAGYLVLGLIVERISGQAFYDYVRDRVFGPAGMTGAFYRAMDEDPPRTASGYTSFQDLGATDYRFRLRGRRLNTGQLAIRGGPHGGAYVTADDLLSFMNAMEQGRLVRLETAASMQSAQASVGRKPGLLPGLGFEIEQLNGQTLVGHTGGDLGIGAFAYRFRESGYSVVVISNYDPPAVIPIWTRLRELLAPSRLGDLAAANDCTPSR